MTAKFRIIIGLLALVPITAPASATPQSKTTHLLALAACPPWKVDKDSAKKTKQMAESCKNDIDTIVPALRKTFSIQPQNVSTRLNQEADYSGVENAITGLAAKAKANDRVVIYLNFHGGEFDTSYRGYSTDDEIIATYTQHIHLNFKEAAADKKWMPVKVLRDLVDKIESREIIIIVESCEIGSSMKDFRFDVARRYDRGWNGREAIIFSSSAYQAANYLPDGVSAVFTTKLASHLENATYGSLRDVIHNVALETHRSVRRNCLKGETAADLSKNRKTYLDSCTQMPEVFDPYGLLDDTRVNGEVIVSEWRKIVDPTVSKSVVEIDPAQTTNDPDAAVNKAAAAAKKAEAKKNPPEALAKGEDPFAWTRAYMTPQLSYPLPYGYAPTAPQARKTR